MISDVLDILQGGVASIPQHLSCLFAKCSQTTQWRFFPEKVNAFDVITALGALGSFLAVIGAAIAITQSAKARNLSTVVELTRQLAAEREKAHSFKVYEIGDGEFHAFQMVHLVEQAAMIVNNNWVSGQSKAFLLDWLRMEIPSMAMQPVYQAVFASAHGNELCELFKLRDRFDAERKQEEAKRKQMEHFERIYEHHKTSRSK